MFDPTSRYYPLEKLTLERDGKDPVKYVERRFLPPPEELQTLSETAVLSGDRPDLIAWRTLGDPLQFWRVGDANRVMDPAEMGDEPGATIRIPMPQP